jgi:membrane associated rhomboid family serine protease
VILPVGDSPNPEGTPVATYCLLAANVAVYLLTLPLAWTSPDAADPRLAEYVHVVARHTGYRTSIPEILASTSAYDLLVFSWGYRPVDPSLVNLFASMFLHGGFAHLVGNMLFLWIYGDNVEHRVGPARFVAYYLVTGASATLMHAMFFPTSGLPLVGASGAISGVLGFYFLWFPSNRVHLLLLFPFLLRVTVPARTLLGLYIVVENILPFVLARGAGGVAYGAHIGGFIAGMLIAKAIDRRHPTAPSAAVTAGGGGDVRAAIAAGRFADAARTYLALAPDETRRLLAPEQSIALGDWLFANGQPREALAVYRRHLRDHPSGSRAADAHLGAGLVQMRYLNQPATAYQHFLDALDLEPSPATELAARQALQSLARISPQNP